MYPGHHQQAITYMALARLNHYLGNLNESTKLLESAYDIMKHMFSKEHFMINTLKAELGRNKYMLGDLSTAKQLLEESSLYLNNTNIVYWCWFAKFYLGRVYEALQEYDKALNTTKESVAIAQEHYKEKIHDSMKFQISQAELWPNYNTNKNTILQYLEKTLQFNIQLFGKNHYQTARYHYLLGQVLSNKNQKKQAIDQYTIASTILKTEKEKTKHSNLAKFIQHNLQIIQKKLQTIE